MARTKSTRRVSLRFYAPSNARRMAEHMAPIVMKKVLTSATVESPTYANAEQRQLYWRWVLALLFTADVGHRIWHVTFHSEHVFPEDVEAAHAILEADDPVRHLFASSKLVLSDGPHQVTPKWVSAERFYLERPDLRTSRRVANSPSIQVEPQALTVRVAGAVSSFSGSVFWVVLYPGHGIAWVDPTDVKIQDKSGSTEEESGSPPTVHIRGMTEANKESNLAFLKMIGGRLQVLEISDFFQPCELDAWCQELFMVCPNLQELDLSEELRLRDLRTIIDSSAAGHCKLQSLQMACIFDVESAHVFDFLEVLCNPVHPLTRHLLHLWMSFEVSSKVGDAFESSILRMLRLNRRLQSVDFSFGGPGSKAIEPITDEFVVRDAPLAISSKVFVLKAVSEASLTGSALGQFDSRVLTSIFEFAAPHRMRNCRCGFY